MTRLPRVKGRVVVRGLEKPGFIAERTRGSHVFMKHPNGRATAVPIHSGPGLLRAILRDVELTVDELTKLL